MYNNNNYAQGPGYGARNQSYSNARNNFQGGNQSYNYPGNAGVYAPRAPKKKSGTRRKIGKNGKDVVFGWKATKGMMFTYFCTETKYSKNVKSKNGREWVTGIIIEVKGRGRNGMTKLYPNPGHPKGLFFGIKDKISGKVICKDMGLVFNPQGGVGGVVARIGGKPRR